MLGRHGEVLAFGIDDFEAKLTWMDSWQRQVHLKEYVAIDLETHDAALETCIDGGGHRPRRWFESPQKRERAEHTHKIRISTKHLPDRLHRSNPRHCIKEDHIHHSTTAYGSHYATPLYVQLRPPTCRSMLISARPSVLHRFTRLNPLSNANRHASTTPRHARPRALAGTRVPQFSGPVPAPELRRDDTAETPRSLLAPTIPPAAGPVSGTGDTGRNRAPPSAASSTAALVFGAGDNSRRSMAAFTRRHRLIADSTYGLASFLIKV